MYMIGQNDPGETKQLLSHGTSNAVPIFIFDDENSYGIPGIFDTLCCSSYLIVEAFFVLVALISDWSYEKKNLKATWFSKRKKPDLTVIRIIDDQRAFQISAHACRVWRNQERSVIFSEESQTEQQKQEWVRRKLSSSMDDVEG